jgi:superfamily II DNA or RNA helicase
MFEIGAKVVDVNDRQFVGIVTANDCMHGGMRYYEVFWGHPRGTTMVPEADLRLADEEKKPSQALAEGDFGSFRDFQRALTYRRLVRNAPLANHYYAFGASRTRFYPYQFKPLVKLLESDNDRILICDEVGLGKTIEAGLILIELQARRPLNTVVVACPSNLKTKWREEMKRRFAQDFRPVNSAEFIELIEEQDREPDRTSFNLIVALESLRRRKVIRRLEELAPPIDLVIVDEAHHLRNTGTDTRRAARLITQSAGAVVMLTATPIQTGDENLFNLLTLLDERDFQSFDITRQRLEANVPIIRAQRLLSRLPPDLPAVQEALTEASEDPWFAANPVLDDMRARVRAFTSNGSSSGISSLVGLQRDAASLNLLGHILTRTRRRDVHVSTAKRNAFAVEVHLTPRERQLYDAVTEYARAMARATHSAAVQEWLVMLPQRRLASSIPAMVRHYKRTPPSVHSIDEEDDWTTASEDDGRDRKSAAQELMNIVANWRDDEPDSKYQSLTDVLQELRREGPVKIVVFAFFKDTLRYLAERLTRDGFGTSLLTGDLPIDERSAVIERFRDDPDIEVLLSSRVGSEGLDFQFCSTMVNYDLPWNPMEVEQRIGRLDRIGQEAKVIRIYSFWATDTIEQRILQRLYERVGVFERSIGDLEAILGDVVRGLEAEVFRRDLTREEEQAAALRAEQVLAARQEELAELESSSATFVGTDHYFEAEVDRIRTHRRYVTAIQLERFVGDFLRGEAAETRLEYDRTTRRGRLWPDRRLQRFIQHSKRVGDLVPLLNAGKGGLPLTFDGDLAFREPRLEFVNQAHPLIAAVVEHYEATREVNGGAHAIEVATTVAAPGEYVMMTYLLTIHAARPEQRLFAVVLDHELNPLLNEDECEVFLGEVLDQGEELLTPIERCGPVVLAKAPLHAQVVLQERLDGLRQRLSAENASFVLRRVTALELEHERRLRSLESRLAAEMAAGKRTAQLTQGKIAKSRAAYEKRMAELEKRRQVGIQYEEVAAAVVRVACPQHETNLGTGE